MAATETTQDNVLRCAARLFALRGYDDVSVREVVEAAGVTKPALYYHFGSKEGVAEALAMKLIQRIQDVRERAFAEIDDLRQMLRHIARENLLIAKSDQHSVAFVFGLWFGRASIQNTMAKINHADCQIKQDWLNELQRRGLDTNVAEVVSSTFWALLMQDLLTVAFGEHEIDVDQRATQIANITLDGALYESRE